jgi:hypothetical protein
MYYHYINIFGYKSFLSSIKNNILMRSVLFQVVTQLIVVIPY